MDNSHIFESDSDSDIEFSVLSYQFEPIRPSEEEKNESELNENESWSSEEDSLDKSSRLGIPIGKFKKPDLCYNWSFSEQNLF